jgi:FkbM family methyltransferase
MSKFLNKIRDLIAYDTLQRRAKRHLSNGEDQLVVFSFDDIGHSINLFGKYEKEELDVFFQWAASQQIDFANAVAIDIGANIGNHSLFFARRFRTVLSFEPNPRTFRVLSLNAELAANVELFGFGLSNANCSARMKINRANIGASYVTEDRSQAFQEIALRTLDSVVDANLDVKLIKIDVEGHEYQALCGAKNLIQSQKPLVLFEQQLGDFINAQSRVVNLLKDFGYKDFAVLRSPLSNTRIRNRYLRAAYRAALGEILGRKLTLSRTSEIGPGNHPFIVAIPDWVRK